MMKAFRSWLSSLTGRVALLLAGLFLIVQLVAVWAFVTHTDHEGIGWATHMFAWSLMSGALVLAFSIWALRRLTAPYRRFADAAERIGQGDLGERLELEGGSELKRATAAFNQMQDQLERLLDDRVRMTAAVAHDMRTGLTRLRLRAETMPDENTRNRTIADIDDMQRMITTITEFARDDMAGEAPVELDLAALLQAIVEDASELGDEARYEGPDALDHRLRPVAMRRAVQNLVDNALKYGGEAEVRLKTASGLVRIEICDRGPGLPEADLARVLEAFERSDSSSTSIGVGLGLAIARNIVLGHGGDLRLENRQRGGLRAIINLPGGI